MRLRGSHARLAGPRRARRGRKALMGVGVLAGVGAVLVGLVSGSAAALFTSQGALRGAEIQAGDMWANVGTMTWQQVTPGVAGSSPSPLTSTPTGFLSMPGDIVEIRAPVTAFLKGDNLVADLTLDYTSPDAAAGAISAEFRVEDAKGTQVVPPTPANNSVVIPGLVGSDAGVTSTWTAVLRVEVLGNYQWVTPTSDPQQTWSAGTLLATLKQVRAPGGGPT